MIAALLMVGAAALMFAATRPGPRERARRLQFAGASIGLVVGIWLIVTAIRS